MDLLSNHWWQYPGVCGEEFHRKEDLKKAIQYRIEDCKEYPERMVYHEDFFLEILSHHHRWTEKKGVGISHLTVEKITHHRCPSWGLVLHRVDGTREDISWVKAISPNGGA
jgi:hypothetical protein